MWPGRFDTLVSRCKRHSSRTKPKGHEVFYRREVFRSGDGIFLVDRNPIWTSDGAEAGDYSKTEGQSY
jgi:hypothetical protein